MIKFKYYFKNNLDKETIGYVYAENISEAYYIASKIKKLEISIFKELFNIEKV